MVYEHSETVQRHQHSMNESVTDQRTKGLGQVLVMLTHLKKNQVADYENFRPKFGKIEFLSISA